MTQEAGPSKKATDGRHKRPTAPDGLASLVNRRRDEMGTTLSKIARDAGVDGTLVWQISHGVSANPKVLVLAALGHALQVPFAAVCEAALADALLLPNPLARARKVGRPEAAEGAASSADAHSAKDSDRAGFDLPQASRADTRTAPAPTSRGDRAPALKRQTRMTAYEALTAAYRDKAGVAGDNPDDGLGTLFDGIASFAESDSEQPSATAHELEFLAGVLLLAAQKVTGDDGAT